MGQAGWGVGMVLWGLDQAGDPAQPAAGLSRFPRGPWGMQETVVGLLGDTVGPELAFGHQILRCPMQGEVGRDSP